MRRLLFAPLVACMLALTSMLSITAVARPCCNGPLPLKCTMELAIDLNDEYAHWEGPVAGDLTGTLQLWEHWSEIFFTGAIEHYFEDFVILVGDDQITGSDRGVWNFGTFQFSYSGTVTGATGDWAYLEGWNIHGKGVTSEYPNDTGLITAEGTFAIVPP